MDHWRVEMNILHLSNGYCCTIHDLQNKRADKTDDKYIYHTYTLFSLSSIFSGYQKPRTAFLEEREDDEDIPKNYEFVHEARTKLLKQQVHLFLNEFPCVVHENWILRKSNTLCILRFDKLKAFRTEREKREAGNKAMEEHKEGG